MRAKWALAVGLGLAAVEVAMAAHGETEVDPYVWLEDVGGDVALDWVKERNAESNAELTKKPDFAELERKILSILDSTDRIPYVGKHGDHYYNFWQDAEHVR